jgi:hypothetical protein
MIAVIAGTFITLAYYIWTVVGYIGSFALSTMNLFLPW